jgi:hypothetical protein
VQSSRAKLLSKSNGHTILEISSAFSITPSNRFQMRIVMVDEHGEARPA